MHELSLCGAIAEIVTRRAGERPVRAIHLQIGVLRQVVPETLEFCWEMVSSGTTLADSTLVVDHVSAQLQCRSCATAFPLPDPPAFACARCGGLDVQVLTGEECAVTTVEFAAAAGAPTSGGDHGPLPPS